MEPPETCDQCGQAVVPSNGARWSVEGTPDIAIFGSREVCTEPGAPSLTHTVNGSPFHPGKTEASA